MMKRITWILLCLLLFACKKEYPTPYEQAKDENSGRAFARINGKADPSWITKAVREPSQGNRPSLDLAVYNNGYMIHHLLINHIDLAQKHQKIQAGEFRWRDWYADKHNDSCRAYFFLKDDDAVENTYFVDDNAPDNYLDIESYNAVSNHMKGSFNITMFRSNLTVPQTQGYPDTLHITNGKFDVFIK